MNERQLKALEELLNSKKYRDVYPETVKNAFLEQLGRHAKLKDADKAARAHLHAITGAFISPDELSSAKKELLLWLSGDSEALGRALAAHSSTRERLSDADALYDRIFEITGVPETVLDIACGMNPVYLGARGITNVTGVDIHAGLMALVNLVSEAKGWKTRVRAGDVLSEFPTENADVTLVMKLLPVLETQKSGSARCLLENVRGRRMVITFPTKTLGGRGVGMEKNYTEWFEKTKPENFKILDRFVIGSELVYVTERTR